MRLSATSKILSRMIIVGTVLVGGVQIAHAHDPQSIEIKSLVYNPTEVTLHVGDSIEWVNNDSISHTASAKADAVGGPWEVVIPPGKSAKREMNDVGTVDYYCRFHPNMKARIIVLAKQNNVIKVISLW
jgi:plastocyanin